MQAEWFERRTRNALNRQSIALLRMPLCVIGFLRLNDCRMEKNNPLVTVSRAGDVSLLSIALLSIAAVSVQTRICTWAHSCILGMSFLISLLLFFPPPTSHTSCHWHFTSSDFSDAASTSPCHPPTHAHIHTPNPTHTTSFFPLLLMKAESNRRSICIYITHVMSSALSRLGSTAWCQHATSENRTPIISRPHLKAHFTWCTSGGQQLLMQPVQSALPPTFASPHHFEKYLLSY